MAEIYIWPPYIWISTYSISGYHRLLVYVHNLYMVSSQATPNRPALRWPPSAAIKVQEDAFSAFFRTPMPCWYLGEHSCSRPSNRHVLHQMAPLCFRNPRLRNVPKRLPFAESRYMRPKLYMAFVSPACAAWCRNCAADNSSFLIPSP